VVPVGDEAVVAAPARAGSASSSSSDEEKKAKKNKTKSRSASRKRASIFGGLLGKKDKAEEHKVEGESSKAHPEALKEEAPIVPVTESMYHCSDLFKVYTNHIQSLPPHLLSPRRFLTQARS
jgi:hypothetical protein